MAYFSFAMKMTIVMTTKLQTVIVLALFACVDPKTSDKHQSTVEQVAVESDTLLLEAKIQVIETVLNLPGVIYFSKVDYISAKYGRIFLLFESPEIPNLPPIMQRGKELQILTVKDSVTQSMPCYVFDILEIENDSALVRMRFDLTGAIARGKLVKSNGTWVPEENFLVGVR